MADTLDCLETETADNPQMSVVWLHGLGADANDFAPIVPMLNLSRATRFVFPNAPMRPVTINGGMEMRAWYDIDLSNPLVGSDDIRESSQALAALVEREQSRGMKPNQIVVAGFSQGGVIASHFGLRSNDALAGILALSTYVHDVENLTSEISFASIDVPIFMAHGLQDPVLPIARAVGAREALLELGYKVEWHEYAMGHEVNVAEIADISAWLNTLGV